MDEYRGVIFTAVQGYRPLRLDLLLPTGPLPGGAESAPVAVWIHGGAWRQGTRDVLPPELATLFDALLDAGIAVAAVDYRLSAEARYPAPLDDVRAALDWLRTHGARYGVDADRLAVWGDSAGGHLAGLVALTDPGVRCAVLLYPPTDLLSLQEQMPPDGALDHNAPDSPESQLLGGPVPARPELARAASPLSYAHADAPPILLVHGTADRLVPARQSELFAARLREVGAPVELLLVPGADHVFAGYPEPAALLARAAEFTRVHLAG